MPRRGAKAACMQSLHQAGLRFDRHLIGLKTELTQGFKDVDYHFLGGWVAGAVSG